MALCEVCLGTDTAPVPWFPPPRLVGAPWHGLHALGIGDGVWIRGDDTHQTVSPAQAVQPGLPEFSFDVWGQPLANKTLLTTIA